MIPWLLLDPAGAASSPRLFFMRRIAPGTPLLQQDFYSD